MFFEGTKYIAIKGTPYVGTNKVIKYELNRMYNDCSLYSHPSWCFSSVGLVTP